MSNCLGQLSGHKLCSCVHIKQVIDLILGMSERKRKRKSRWGGNEESKVFIPGMPTILPSNLTKEQEQIYLCMYFLFFRFT